MAKNTKQIDAGTVAAIMSLYHPERAARILNMMRRDNLSRGRAVTLTRRAYKRADRVNGTSIWND
jgi:hypothetical protein